MSAIGAATLAYRPLTPVPDNGTYQVCYFDAAPCADWVCGHEQATITSIPAETSWTCNVSSGNAPLLDFGHARRNDSTGCDGYMWCIEAGGTQVVTGGWKNETSGAVREMGAWSPVRLVVAVMCLSLIAGHLA
ncbi:hypothetical protein IAT38_006032 [Cryptococcus sp. DSM 104549]